MFLPKYRHLYCPIAQDRNLFIVELITLLLNSLKFLQSMVVVLKHSFIMTFFPASNLIIMLFLWSLLIGYIPRSFQILTYLT